MSKKAVPTDSAENRRLRAELEELRARYAAEQETRRESEQATEAALAGLYEADRLKTVFLATVSHELRTPLTSISGFTSLLLESWDSFEEAQRIDFLERVLRNSETLRRLIEEVLAFTELDRGLETMELIEVDLGSLVGEVLDDNVPVTESHDLTRALPEGVRAIVDLDALRRSLVNLLVNAVRYSPAGSAVQVGVRTEGGHAVLSVADAGPGFAPEERDSVFEPFYRGRAKAVLSTQGSGIGLTVVKRLVESMDGRVSIGTSEAGGAHLEIFLPMPSSGADVDA